MNQRCFFVSESPTGSACGSENHSLRGEDKQSINCIVRTSKAVLNVLHSRWHAKWDILFMPKYQRDAFYGEKWEAMGLKQMESLYHFSRVLPDYISMLVEMLSYTALRDI